jgi:hypothetical protein
VPTLIEPGFDEIRAGDLEGAGIDAYRSWRDQHTVGDRLPHGESIEDALWRYAGALRRLLARKEKVTLVVIHKIALRYITSAAAADPSPLNGTAFPKATPYLFDEPAVRRAAASLAALTVTAKPAATAKPAFRDEAARRVTAPGRRGPQLRWRPLSGNLIDRRGAALAPPILLAIGLNVAAVTGLADTAGFRAVYASLIRIQWPWLCAVPAALAMLAIGYYFAYRWIYAAEGGYRPVGKGAATSRHLRRFRKS